MVMKQIPLRTFQQSAQDYTNDLPIILTKYGKPAYVVLPYDVYTQSKKSVYTNTPNIEKKEKVYTQNVVPSPKVSTQSPTMSELIQQEIARDKKSPSDTKHKSITKKTIGEVPKRKNTSILWGDDYDM